MGDGDGGVLGSGTDWHGTSRSLHRPPGSPRPAYTPTACAGLRRRARESGTAAARAGDGRCSSAARRPPHDRASAGARAQRSGASARDETRPLHAAERRLRLGDRRPSAAVRSLLGCGLPTHTNKHARTHARAHVYIRYAVIGPARSRRGCGSRAVAVRCLRIASVNRIHTCRFRCHVAATAAATEQPCYWRRALSRNQPLPIVCSSWPISSAVSSPRSTWRGPRGPASCCAGPDAPPRGQSPGAQAFGRAFPASTLGGVPRSPWGTVAQVRLMRWTHGGGG